MSDVIVCLPWRFRGLCPQLASVKRRCSDCGEDVMLQAANATAADNMVIVCAACIVKLRPDLLMKDCGGLIGGEKFTSIEKALHAANALSRRN